MSSNDASQLSLTRRCAAILLVLFCTSPTRSEEKQPASFAKEGVAFLKTHCYHCHGDRFIKAELDLTTYQDDQAIVKDRKVWLKVMQMVEGGEMPPLTRPQP